MEQINWVLARILLFSVFFSMTLVGITTKATSVAVIGSFGLVALFIVMCRYMEEYEKKETEVTETKIVVPFYKLEARIEKLKELKIKKMERVVLCQGKEKDEIYLWRGKE